MRKHGSTMTEGDFWAMGLRVGQCLEWQGSVDSTGYPQVTINGMNERAHRMAWLFRYGALDAGLQVCHTCDNKRCIEPLHLFTGTLADNMRDYRLRRGRPLRVAKGRFVLSPDQIREIRRLVAEGATQASVSKQFGVVHQTISKVVNRERWHEVA